ncbi:MAG TPA: glycosyltransferase family 39 protein [Phycisphaerae bacterium]|nr:glycosyltransferase family 39 protein [Phycisphaerae bacterium]
MEDSTRVRSFPLVYLGLVAAGVLIRLLFLLLAGELEPYADENFYLYHGLCMERFSLYQGGVAYLWPPGYPFFLAVFLRLFQGEAVFAAKLCQVLLAGVVGWTLLLFANRLFSRRAAFVAGVVWAVYLPFIGFTHYLWPEMLCLAVSLPAFYLLFTWWMDSERGVPGNGRLLAAGLLFGVALLIKEVLLYFSLVIAVLILWRHRRFSWRGGLSHVALFLLSVIVVVLPWSLRNYEVYGRVAPVGITLGANCYQGVVRPYACFDYPRIDYTELWDEESWVYRRFIVQPPGWPAERVHAPNMCDESTANVKLAMGLTMEHPWWFARSRIKRLANWLAPWSFFVRHHGLGRYHGLLNEAPVRDVLVVLCLLQTAAIIALSVPGFLLSLRQPMGRALLGWLLLYGLATALLVGMSRHRMVVEPFLIVLSAGFVTGAGRPWRGRRLAVGVVAAYWIVLVLLWSINQPEMSTFLDRVWHS